MNQAAEPRDDAELLAQCVDQMSAKQYVAHHQAGEFNARPLPDGDFEAVQPLFSTTPKGNP